MMMRGYKRGTNMLTISVIASLLQKEIVKTCNLNKSRYLGNEVACHMYYRLRVEQC
jgi:hypothetical protein